MFCTDISLSNARLYCALCLLFFTASCPAYYWNALTDEKTWVSPTGANNSSSTASTTTYNGRIPERAEAKFAPDSSAVSGINPLNSLGDYDSESE